MTTNKIPLLRMSPSPVPPAPEGGLGNLEMLPTELIQLVTDQLLGEPHALAGFAATSKLALEHTNRSIARLLPPSHRPTTNRLGEWTARFRTLTPEMQQTLKAAAGYLPCPNIFSPIEDEAVAQLHDPLAAAMRHLAADDPRRAKSSFELLEANAKAAGVPVPDATGILLTAAARYLDRGRIGMTKYTFELLGTHAQAAGVPVPDATGILLTAAKACLDQWTQTARYLDAAENSLDGVKGAFKRLKHEAKASGQPLPPAADLFLSAIEAHLGNTDFADIIRDAVLLLGSYGTANPTGAQLFSQAARSIANSKKYLAADGADDMKTYFKLLKANAKAAGVDVEDDVAQLRLSLAQRT